MEYYFYRAGHHPNRPGLMTGNVNGDRGRIEVVAAMDELGLPAFYQEKKFGQEQMNKLPDSEILTADQIEAMPPYVRAFKCGNQFEKGEPCGEYKFTNTGDEVCEKRKYRVSWHPGWYVLPIRDFFVDSAVRY